MPPMPLPLRRPLSVVEPVPPLDTGRIPVMSEVRSIREVETIPALAFKNPFREPNESESIETFEAIRFDIEAFVVDEFKILVNCVDVAYTKPPLSIFTFPAKVEVSLVDVAAKNEYDPSKGTAPPINPGAVSAPRIVTSPLIVTGPEKVLVAAASGPENVATSETSSVVAVNGPVPPVPTEESPPDQYPACMFTSFCSRKKSFTF